MQERVILITGASRGLGAATALWLAQKKCSLALNARNASALDQVATRARDLGARVEVFPGDIGEVDFCQSVVEQAVKKFGHLNCLINNAAVIEPIGNFTKCDPRVWQKSVNINLVGPLALSHYAAQTLSQNQGIVINVSTGAAVHPLPSWNMYCATKAGLHHLTRTMAAEERSITCLSLRPGVVDTAMQDQIRRDGPGNMPEDLTAYFQQLKDTKRLEPPEIPAKAMAWLALFAPKDWSGEMIEYTDPRVVQAADQFFGPGLG